MSYIKAIRWPVSTGWALWEALLFHAKNEVDEAESGPRSIILVEDELESRI